MEEDINNYLDQVTLEELLQYFEDRKIPLPSDVSKKVLINFLIHSSEHKTDARAAVLLELRNSARLLQKTIRDSTDKLQSVIDAVDLKRQTLSDDLKREVGGVRTLTHTFQIITGALGVVVTLGGVFGFAKLSELETKAAAASGTLSVVTGLVDSYRAHILRIAQDDLNTLMDGASTRWFWDADRPLRTVVSSDQQMILAARQTPDNQPSPLRSSLDIVGLHFDAIAHVLSIAGETEATLRKDISAADFLEIEKEWLALETRIDSAALPAPDKQRLLAFVHNMLGTTYYQRNRTQGKQGSAEDLENAVQRFRKSVLANPQYAAPCSNLAVVLLDRIERATEGANAAERARLEKAIDEPEALLKRARNYEQSPRAKSKILNNLAYGELQRAFLRETAADLPAAMKHAENALDWLAAGLEQNGSAAVLFATRAEITAYKAYITALQGAPDAVMAGQAVELLQEARRRSYDFKAKDAAGFFYNSPSFARFVARFPAQKPTVLKSVGVA